MRDSILRQRNFSLIIFPIQIRILNYFINSKLEIIYIQYYNVT